MLRLFLLLLVAARGLEHPVAVSVNALWSHTLGLSLRCLGALVSRMSNGVGPTTGYKVRTLTRFLHRCLRFFATPIRSYWTPTRPHPQDTNSAAPQSSTQTTPPPDTNHSATTSMVSSTTTTSSTRRLSLFATPALVLIAFLVAVSFLLRLQNSTTTHVANAKEQPS